MAGDGPTKEQADAINAAILRSATGLISFSLGEGPFLEVLANAEASDAAMEDTWGKVTLSSAYDMLESVGPFSTEKLRGVLFGLNAALASIAQSKDGVDLPVCNTLRRMVNATIKLGAKVEAGGR